MQRDRKALEQLQATWQQQYAKAVAEQEQLAAAEAQQEAAAAAANADTTDADGMATALPTGWYTAFDSTHQAWYYYHPESGVTQWTGPKIDVTQKDGVSKSELEASTSTAPDTIQSITRSDTQPHAEASAAATAAAATAEASCSHTIVGIQNRAEASATTDETLTMPGHEQAVAESQPTPAHVDGAVAATSQVDFDHILVSTTLAQSTQLSLLHSDTTPAAALSETQPAQSAATAAVAQPPPEVAAVASRAAPAAQQEAATINTTVISYASNASATAANGSAVAATSGWCYCDAYGQVQGPFSEELLRCWRHLLPMDLLVWYRDTSATTASAAAAAEEESATTAAGIDSGTAADSAAVCVSPNVQLSKQTNACQPADERQQEAAALPDSQRAAVRASPASAAQPPNISSAAQPPNTTSATHNSINDRHDDDIKTAGCKTDVACAAGHDDTDTIDGDDSPCVELAELLGDGALIASWKQSQQIWQGVINQCVGAPPGTSPEYEAPPAPPAPVWQHWLDLQQRSGQGIKAAPSTSASGAIRINAANGGNFRDHTRARGLHPQLHHSAGGIAYHAGSPASVRQASSNEKDSNMQSYAEAVLAGLPPDDEAVQLARLARQYNRPLQEVLEFSWNASSAATAAGVNATGGAGTERVVYVRDPRSGRLTATHEPQGEHKVWGGCTAMCAKRLQTVIWQCSVAEVYHVDKCVAEDG